MADDRWGRQVALTFGNTELSTRIQKPHELEQGKIGRLIYDQLSKTLAESAGPSLARTIYDALSLKPGLLGISLDLKVLLEGTFPTLKQQLNNLRLTRG